METLHIDPHRMHAAAEDAAAFLRSVSNPHRLMILCKLTTGGEQSVGELVEMLGINQACVSQHLARLRAEDYVRTRREGTTIYYALASDKVAPFMETIYRLFSHEASEQELTAYQEAAERRQIEQALP